MSLDINNVMRIREQFNNHASREIEPDPFIWEKYLEYLETGQYPYHSSVVEFIAKGFPELTDEQKDGIHTNSYLCSQKKRKLDRINLLINGKTRNEGEGCIFNQLMSLTANNIDY